MFPDGSSMVISGASSGIGRALAQRMSAEGARLVISGRDDKRLRRVADALPGPVACIVGDIADPVTSARIVDLAIAEYGRIDAVLANAGLYLPDPGWQVPASRVHDLVSANVLGVMHLVHAALPLLIEQAAGDVLITGSVSGHQAISWEPVYSASKHALTAFTHATRQQLLGTGVRVGAVAPGIVLNELWGVGDGDSGIEEKVAAGAGIRSEDVADAVCFMLSRPAHVTIRDLVILPTNQPI